MPIYAYKCESCGHTKDVLQKMSDALLVDCPACGAPAFKKQLTAAGFQLKGSGWYVTDFRDAKSDGKGGADKAKDGDKGKGKDASKESGSPDKADTATSTALNSAATPGKGEAAKLASAPTSAPTSAPASTPASSSPAPVPKAAA